MIIQEIQICEFERTDKENSFTWKSNCVDLLKNLFIFRYKNQYSFSKNCMVSPFVVFYWNTRGVIASITNNIIFNTTKDQFAELHVSMQK